MIEGRHKDTAGARRNAGDEDLRRRDRRHAQEERKKALDAALDDGLKGTFPGSDPVAVTQPPRSVYDRGAT